MPLVGFVGFRVAVCWGVSGWLVFGGGLGFRGDGVLGLCGLYMGGAGARAHTLWQDSKHSGILLSGEVEKRQALNF